MKRIAFTIVLNGNPFIEKQIGIIPEIFDVWYIVEGATTPIHDTDWCKNIDNVFYDDKKLSVDGTSKILDDIASDKIHIIRKNDFWSGKVEMCNSFMDKVENCTLMQFDVDEIWNPNVLDDVLTYAENNSGFDGMLFKCNYYVGPNIKVVSDNCYGNRAGEWCRLWKVKDSSKWVSHEPPHVFGLNRFIPNNFTSSKGWIFDHYAYVLEDQIKFKENFYGYNGAYNQWKSLQLSSKFPTRLGNYLQWVKDDSIVNLIN